MPIDVPSIAEETSEKEIEDLENLALNGSSNVSEHAVDALVDIAKGSLRNSGKAITALSRTAKSNATKVWMVGINALHYLACISERDYLSIPFSVNVRSRCKTISIDAFVQLELLAKYPPTSEVAIAALEEITKGNRGYMHEYEDSCYDDKQEEKMETSFNMLGRLMLNENETVRTNAINAMIRLAGDSIKAATTVANAARVVTTAKNISVESAALIAAVKEIFIRNVMNGITGHDIDMGTGAADYVLKRQINELIARLCLSSEATSVAFREFVREWIRSTSKDKHLNAIVKEVSDRKGHDVHASISERALDILGIIIRISKDIEISDKSAEEFATNELEDIAKNGLTAANEYSQIIARDILTGRRR